MPNVKTSVYSCKTNLPPNTAFRGFGGPQGMFVIESAIATAADVIGIDKRFIQEANLIDRKRQIFLWANCNSSRSPKHMVYCKGSFQTWKKLRTEVANF